MNYKVAEAEQLHVRVVHWMQDDFGSSILWGAEHHQSYRGG